MLPPFYHGVRLPPRPLAFFVGRSLVFGYNAFMNTSTSLSSERPAPHVFLFLDIEGTLRARGDQDRLSGAPFLLRLARHLEACGATPRVIISSSLRHEAPSDRIAAWIDLSAPGLGAYVAGSTGSASSIRPGLSMDHPWRLFGDRHLECLDFLSGQPEPRLWLALDDTPSLFMDVSERLPQELIVCEASRGFSDSELLIALNRLRLWLHPLGIDLPLFEDSEEPIISPRYGR